MKIATWNVNSIKARLPRVLEWLSEFQPDVALLQEIKSVEAAFPSMEIGDAGYNVAVSGQKTYNGVAILSKHPIDVELSSADATPTPVVVGDQHEQHVGEVPGAGVFRCRLGAR